MDIVQIIDSANKAGGALTIPGALLVYIIGIHTGKIMTSRERDSLVRQVDYWKGECYRLREEVRDINRNLVDRQIDMLDILRRLVATVTRGG